jgi:putative SOS response-associated peptidase YedK
MCGRFTLRAPASVVAAQFGLFEMAPFAPRFNVAPTQSVAVVRCLAGEPERELAWLRWGLIPPWAKDAGVGNRMINARAETAAEKPSYRAAFRRRRCLVAADGFYEWQRTGKRKQPYFIRMEDDRPFAFAGLWETWEGAGEGPVQSCTLLTTEPNALVAPIHNRMPVILAEDDYARWLDPSIEEPVALAPLLRSFPAEGMVAFAVSSYVNSPSRDDARCIERAGEFPLGF